MQQCAGDQSALTISGADPQLAGFGHMVPPIQISTARPVSSAGGPDPGRAVAPLIISVFRNELDNAPTSKETSWAELCENLMAPRRAACTLETCARAKCPHKKITAWSPASWPANATREKLTVEAVCALVVDLDHVPPQALEARLERLAGFQYIMHSSHSDRPDDRCVRLVFALSHAVLGVDFARFWPTAIAELDVPADPQTKDAGRLYFLPSRPSDACGDVYDGSGFDCAENDGDPLDVDAILARAPAAAPAPAPITVPAFHGRPDTQAMEQAVEVLAKVWPSKGRHRAHLALAGALTRSGWPVELVAEFGAAVAERAEPGNADYEKRHAAARSSADKLAAGEAISGWPTLIEFVGHDAIDQVTELLGIGPQPDDGFVEAMTALAHRAAASAGNFDEPSTNASGTVATAAKYVCEHRTDPEGVTLRRCQGVWYSWSRDSGCYREISDEELHADLYRKLNLRSKHEVADVAHALIAVDDVLIPHAKLGEWLDGTAIDRHDVVGCKNGLLHLPTMELRPATPAYFATRTLGVAYDPSAPEPKRWLRFLGEVFPDDDESIATLQEFFGYLLTPDSRQQKIFLLWGGKRSGKGTVGRVLDALLGDGNVASPTLTSLGSQFGLQPLIGCMVAVIRDARLGGRVDVAQVIERLLSISGQDQQTIDRKNKMAWTGTLTVRFMILTNELPKVPDPSGALASRIILLRFAQSFYGREDEKLTDSLLQELPGILRWAAVGWARLRTRGRFCQPPSSREFLDVLQDLGDPVGAWVRECCDTGADMWVPKDEAMKSYRAWCFSHDEKHTLSSSEFGRDLSSAGYMAGKAPRDTEGKRTPIYKGLRLRGTGNGKPTPACNGLRGPGGPGDS